MGKLLIYYSYENGLTDNITINENYYMGAVRNWNLDACKYYEGMIEQMTQRKNVQIFSIQRIGE